MHRDGVDYVYILLVSRHNVTGGTSVISRQADSHVARHLFSEAFEMLILDDHRVRHFVEPIACLDTETIAFRDVLVVTYRSAEPPSA